MTFMNGSRVFKAGVGSSNPQSSPLDIFCRMRIFTISTPAKPLLCMLNSGGFFLFRGNA